MLIDVRPDHLKIVQEILQHYIPHRIVVAFGSRARRTAKEYSDLDLCVMGPSHLSFETLANLRDAFSLSIIPYKVDIVDWESLTPEFQGIINEHSILVQDGTSL